MLPEPFLPFVPLVVSDGVGWWVSVPPVASVPLW
jgi:hypothetical protein